MKVRIELIHDIEDFNIANEIIEINSNVATSFHILNPISLNLIFPLLSCFKNI